MIRPLDASEFDDCACVSELVQVADLRCRFTRHLERKGLRGEMVQGWALIITELVNNAIEHGCLRPGDVVTVGWRIAPSDVVVSVKDPGPCNLTRDDFDAATCDGFAETGRGAGLFLVRAWVDDVDVRPCEPTGTEIMVLKRREPQTGTEL